MKKYKLVSDVRLLFSGKDEIRIRSGLWNYNEAVIDISSLSEECKRVVKDMLSKLSNQSFSENELEGLSLAKDEMDQVKDLLVGLEQAGMVYSNDSNNLKSRVTDVILGKMKDSLVMTDLNPQRVLYISDSSYNLNQVKDLASKLKLSLDYKDIDFIRDVTKYDLTTQYDALDTESAYEAIYRLIKDYDCYVISLKHTNMIFLRNMNRICLKYNKKMVIGMLDGPFITAFSITPPVTGCAECFENRILARLEDHRLYERYVQNDLNINDELDSAKTILSSIMSNVLVSEAFLLSNYNLTKFEGRVLSIFYPTLEIQTQELLRVPYCPACGKISQAKFEELNISSRVIVDNLLKTISMSE